MQQLNGLAFDQFSFGCSVIYKRNFHGKEDEEESGEEKRKRKKDVPGSLQPTTRVLGCCLHYDSVPVAEPDQLLHLVWSAVETRNYKKYFFYG